MFILDYLKLESQNEGASELAEATVYLDFITVHGSKGQLRSS